MNARSTSAWLRISFLASFALIVAWSQRSSQEALVSVTVLDATTGEATPVRVRLTGAAGEPLLSESAIGVSQESLGLPETALAVMYGRGDRAEGFALQPDGSFYADGFFEIPLPPGRYHLSLSKGYEFVGQRHELSVRPGEALSRTYRLHRWINMPEKGWYSADAHIHLRRSPREDPLILRWIAAEDVHVGHLLQVGDFWRTYFAQYAFGREGRYQEEGPYLLSSGQEEPRTPELGHTISLGAEEFVRFQGRYYFYDEVFDRVRELGGIAGFAHHAMTFHAYRGMALLVPQEKVDFLETMQFCGGALAGSPQLPGPLAVDQYYHYLDLGFPLTALAGSDFPYCRASAPSFGLPEGHSRIGAPRFYTYTGSSNTLSFDEWLAAAKAGRTFVTSGPMVELTVNGRLPGDTLDVRPGDTLRIAARAFGHPDHVPLDTLEIVGHGNVLRAVSSDDPGQGRDRLALDLEIPAARGIWIAARVEAGTRQSAHSTPVYVTMDGGGFHNPDTAGTYLARSERFLQELEAELANPGTNLDHQAWRHREGLEVRIAAARKVLAELASRFQSER